MKCARFLSGPIAAATVLLALAPPAFAANEVLVGAGPNIGLWDVGDGHHKIGLYGIAMAHLGTERTVSFRLDGSYSYFWALEPDPPVSNRDYHVLTFLANMVLAIGHSDNRPYWTLGIGYDFPSEGEEDPQYVAGTGVGVRFGWGVIEGRFDAARTNSGAGFYVPIFAAVSF